jgi:hypothetical protein
LGTSLITGWRMNTWTMLASSELWRQSHYHFVNSKLTDKKREKKYDRNVPNIKGI